MCHFCSLVEKTRKVNNKLQYNCIYVSQKIIVKIQWKHMDVGECLTFLWKIEQQQKTFIEETIPREWFLFP